MHPALHSVLILCGGRGERLGGIDKPLRPLAGRPLIEHVLAMLAPECANVVISANRHADQYRAYADTVVDDGIRIDYGPLAGLLAGLAAARCDDVLCIPGDAPLLPPDLYRRLDAARIREGCRLAVVDDGDGLQPLCLLLPRAEASSLTAFAEEGGRAVHRWLATRPHARCDCSNWPRWGWSLNTEDEWRAAEQKIEQESRR